MTELRIDQPSDKKEYAFTLQFTRKVKVTFNVL